MWGGWNENHMSAAEDEVHRRSFRIRLTLFSVHVKQEEWEASVHLQKANANHRKHVVLFLRLFVELKD